jgi:hypothetical protein
MNRWVEVLTAASLVVLCFALVRETSASAATDMAYLKTLIVIGQGNPWHISINRSNP